MQVLQKNLKDNLNISRMELKLEFLIMSLDQEMFTSWGIIVTLIALIH